MSLIGICKILESGSRFIGTQAVWCRNEDTMSRNPFQLPKETFTFFFWKMLQNFRAQNGVARAIFEG
jgi:hypothetical protein